MNQIKVELQETLGNDRQIAEAAWTSSTDYQKKKQRTDEDVKRIINMLADLKHSVPFESVVLRFWMKILISTDRQLMTHRIASHSGMSGRYRTMPNEYLEISKDIEIILDLIPSNRDYFQLYYEICESSNNYYNLLLNDAKEAKKHGRISNDEYKRIREFYRGILPQHNMTERVSIFNLRSFANFVKLRTKEDAQPEIRYLANEMLKQVKEKNIAPLAIEALERNKWII